MNQIRLYGKPIRVNKASADKQKTVEIGAELFIGNLDTMADEKLLYDTFGRFGSLINVPKVARDDVGISKGYGFVSFDDFESSDAAIEHMNGQFLMNREISVQYAYKKDGKGERHGDEAERMLAKQAKTHGVQPAFAGLAPSLFQAPMAPGVPTGPSAVANGDGRGMNALNGPGGYGGPPGGLSHARPTATLPPPPQGLPARPPSGAPPAQFNQPPGFAGPPQGFMPPGAQQNFGQPPPYGQMPSGFPPMQYGRR
jgi:splicing factor 3B subunit 4